MSAHKCKYVRRLSDTYKPLRFLVGTLVPWSMISQLSFLIFFCL